MNFPWFDTEAGEISRCRIYLCVCLRRDCASCPAPTRFPP
ncbi:hypothetical protein A7982_13580 [Minicystis rosea]|nr:hypothetical protein A7982_13580 [Minicystis rosea]